MMPHRQSCDRCRQQKARCTREDPLNDAADPFLPCERCMKAGAVCSYSRECPRVGILSFHSSSVFKPTVTAKQKSGRPVGLSPTHSQADSRHPNSRLLRFLHGSPELSSIGQQGLTGTCPPAKELDISVPNNSLDCNMFHRSSPSNRSITELRPLNTTDLSGWDVSLLSPGPSFTAVQGPWDSHQHMSPENGTATRTSVAPSNRDEDTPEAWTTRLAALATRATQTSKHLAASDISTPLTVSSPQVEEVFDATSTLLRILDSFSGIVRVASSPNLESRSESAPTAAKVVTRDRGLVFLILACHQRLLDCFQAMCNSISRSLRSMSSSRIELGGTLPWKRTLHGDEGMPCVAQLTMVLQLLSHLLNQLDRALNPPLSSLSSSSRGQESRSSFDFATTIDSDASPRWTRSPPGSSNSSQDNAALLLFGHQEAERTKRQDNRQTFMRIAKEMLVTVPDQHSTLNTQIRELQDSINHFGRL